MDIVKILLRQLVIMFLFILIGCGLFKTKRISIQGSKDLGTMLLYVILPCVIVNSYIGIERDSIIMIGMVISFVAAAISLILSIIISRIAFGNKYKIEHFGSAFSNAGFMGIPIVQAVIGTDAVIYISAYVALLNILQWTYGVVVFSGNREAVSISRLATNPIIISFIISIVLYLSQIQLPVVIKTTLNYISGMNAPIAMIIIGVYFGQISIKSLFIDKVTYVSSLVRLFLIPLLTIAVLSFIPACYLDIKLGVLIAASAPIGSNIIIFAEIYKLDCKRAVKEVCMSTICSLLSMPIIITIAEMVW